MGIPLCQFRQTKPFHNISGAFGPLFDLPLPLGSGADILPDCHIGKQRIILKQQPGTPGLGGEIDPFLRVKQSDAVHDNLSAIRLLNPGNAFQGQALPTAGGSQQCNGLISNFKFCFEMKCTQIFFNIHIE